MNVLGAMTPAAFLERHWQKKPRRIAGAVREIPAIGREDLVVLACREGVESRLVIDHGGRRGFEVRHGPFVRRDFSRMPRTRWTLLVQGVDRHVAEAGRLLEAFRFVPNWRVDDVMASWAAPGGGVGPHVDGYDVFLLQALGRRRWGIGRRPVPPERERLVEGAALRVLAGFEPWKTWVLEPGDMLYLPPRIAHHGVALEACVTLSIGFRAPERTELLASVLGRILERADGGWRYEDPDLRAQRHPGEIGARALARIRRALRDPLGDDKALDDAFARFVTDPKPHEEPEPPERPWTAARLRRRIETGAILERSAPCHFAFLRGPGGGARLYVGGQAYPLDRRLAFAAPLLTGRTPLTAKALGPHLRDPRFRRLLLALLDRGYLHWGHSSFSLNS